MMSKMNLLRSSSSKRLRKRQALNPLQFRTRLPSEKPLLMMDLRCKPKGSIPTVAEVAEEVVEANAEAVEANAEAVEVAEEVTENSNPEASTEVPVEVIDPKVSTGPEAMESAEAEEVTDLKAKESTGPEAMASAEAEVTESAEAEETENAEAEEVLKGKESSDQGPKETVSAEVATAEVRGEKKEEKRNPDMTVIEMTKMVMRVSPERNTTLMTGRMELATPTEVTERVAKAEATIGRRLKAKMLVPLPLLRASSLLP
jgi:hypothetical protein